MLQRSHPHLSSQKFVQAGDLLSTGGHPSEISRPESFIDSLHAHRERCTVRTRAYLPLGILLIHVTINPGHAVVDNGFEGQRGHGGGEYGSKGTRSDVVCSGDQYRGGPQRPHQRTGRPLIFHSSTC